MVSQKMYELGANRSMIRELFEYGMQQATVVGPENVFVYSIGNPSIPSPPEVKAALVQVLEQMDSVDIHGYTTAKGDVETRQAIAEDLNQRYGANLHAENFFLTCGAAPALNAVFRALTISENTEFVVIAPYFSEYKPFVESSGGKIIVVEADTEEFQIRFDALEAAITVHTQGVIINSPNNPSGTVYTAETIAKLGELLRRKGTEFGHPIYIISDEPYRELVYDSATVPFIPALYENTIICYSYSKSLSLPGERIGYVCVPDCVTDGRAVYAAVAGASRSFGHVCAPAIWQKALARCTHLRPDLEAYRRNRDLLQKGLQDIGYRTAKADGAFYLFVQVPKGEEQEFWQRAKEKNILFVPGSSFGCPGWFRLCYCVSEDTIRGSLPLFAELYAETV